MMFRPLFATDPVYLLRDLSIAAGGLLFAAGDLSKVLA